jgi:hypothetical protein
VIFPVVPVASSPAFLFFVAEMMHSVPRIVFPALMLCAGFLSAGVAQESGGRPDDARPASPVCLFPPRNASGVHVRPTLVWSEVAGASRYVLEYSDDSLFARIIACDTVDAEPIARPRTPLPHELKVYWRVGALDTACTVMWGAASSVTTAPPLRSRPFSFQPTRRNEAQTASVWVNVPVRSGVTILGAQCRDKSVRVETPFPWISSGIDSLPLSLRFQPTRYGEVRDTLVVFSDHGECRIPIEGSSPGAHLRSSVSAAWLGSVALTDTASTLLRLRNDTQVNDALVKKSRTRTPFFSIVQRPVRPVAPGDSFTIAVRFHPRPPRGEVFGRFVDTLLVEYDGGVERVVLAGESPAPRPVVDRMFLDYGEIAAQDTGVAVVRLANGSINVLRVDSVRSRLRAFQCLHNRALLGKRDTLELAVRFSPGWHGVYRDTLIVYNNSWRGPLRLPLLAVVPFPMPVTDVRRVDFGSVVRGDTASVVLRIGNASPSFLRIDTVRTKYRRFALGVPALPAVVMKGDSLGIRVVFRPDSLMAVHDTLFIVSNGIDRVTRIPIVGAGSAAPPGARDGGVPGDFELFQNFPNPFNATTTFRYVVPVPSRVRLELFTTIGQSVAVIVDGVKEAGYHNEHWRSDVTSGMYYCRLSATPLSEPGRTFVGTRKVVVIR